MTQQLTADNLRSLAEALGMFEKAANQTGVAITGHVDQSIMLGDLTFRLRWTEGADLGQRYTVEFESA